MKTIFEQNVILSNGWGLLTVDGESVLFDEEDFDKINRYKWFIHQHYSTNPSYSGNFRGIVSSSNVLMHRLVKGTFSKNFCVQHLNGDKFDNRKDNLKTISRKDLSLRNNPQLRISDQKGKPIGIMERTKIVKGKSYREVCSNICFNGKRKTTSFSIEKFGRKGAFEKAITWRLNNLSDLGIYFGR